MNLEGFEDAQQEIEEGREHQILVGRRKNMPIYHAKIRDG